jgi:hypothetical protein
LRDDPTCFNDFFSSSLFPTGGSNVRLSFSNGGNLIFFFEHTFSNLDCFPSYSLDNFPSSSD